MCCSTIDKIAHVVYCECTVWPGTQQITGETNQVVSTCHTQPYPGAMTTIFSETCPATAFLPLLKVHFVWQLFSVKTLQSRGTASVLHSERLNGPQVTRRSRLHCTTWTPTSWTPTPWHWKLLGRSFRTTTATRCSPLWASEPNCPLMGECHTSFHWWSQPPLSLSLYVVFLSAWPEKTS